MTTRRLSKVPKYILVVVLWAIALAVLYHTPPVGSWLEAKNLEWQVKRNIDPEKLQAWATNLLAAHPGAGTHWQDYYGTNSNMPPELKKVKGFGYDVEVSQGLNQDESCVWVFCHSKGGPFLVVGAPAKVTPKSVSIISWKPGIYFAGAF
jgi:hypothetical protein